MIARPTRTDWLTLLALGFMWGTSYVFIKLGVESFEPLQVAFGRMALLTLSGCEVST